MNFFNLKNLKIYNLVLLDQIIISGSIFLITIILINFIILNYKEKGFIIGLILTQLIVVFLTYNSYRKTINNYKKF